MSCKYLVCLVLIIQITNAAVTKKISHTRSTNKPTTSSAPDTTTDTEYYVEDEQLDESDDKIEKSSSGNDKTTSRLDKLPKTTSSHTKTHNTFGISTDSSVQDTTTNMIAKSTIKSKYSTTKKASTVSVSIPIKNKNKPAALTSNKDVTTQDYEYEYGDDEKIVPTTKFRKPTTNKYLSAKGTTTGTPLSKSKQNTKLHASSSLSKDGSVDILMSGNKLNGKTIPSKKSSELNGDMLQPDQQSLKNYNIDSSSLMSKKTANLIHNPMAGNHETSSEYYYYYYEDDASTSPTTTLKKQNDATSRNVFKPIGSQITASKSTIKMSSLPTTKLPISTSQGPNSMDTEYYDQDNSLDNLPSETLSKNAILFPQSKALVDDKTTSTKIPPPTSAATTISSSISWHGDNKQIISSHKPVKKPTSSQDDYLTDTDLENDPNENLNMEYDKGPFGQPQMPFSLPGGQFKPIQVSGQRIPPTGSGFQHNLMSGQFFPGNSNPGQPKAGDLNSRNPQSFLSLNLPAVANPFGGQRPPFESSSSLMFKNTDQAIRESPFDEDYSDNLRTDNPVSTSTAKSLNKKNSKVDEKQSTENIAAVGSSKFIYQKSKDKNLVKMKPSESPVNLNSNSEELTTSTELHKGFEKPLVFSQSNQKKIISPQLSNEENKNNTHIKNSGSDNSMRSDSLPLCRTKSGYLKRNAFVLTCKNETVQLQSAYQPWNSVESGYRITLCSSDASSHDKRIIANHPELKDSVNNFQCSKAKGTCIQKFTELIGMIHTDNGGQWECIQIPFGCVCDLPQ